jgi:hypothetical protein
MSRRWKTKLVSNGIHLHPLPRITHLMSLRHDHSSVSPVCPESVQHIILTSKPQPSNLASESIVWVTSGKMSSLTKTLVFKVCGEVMAKFCQNPNLCQKVQFVPNFWFSRPVKFLTVVTHKSPTIWSRIIDHQKAERVVYGNDIQDFHSFGQSKTQKFSSVQLLFYPEIEFSNNIDRQNSVTSKLLVGWGWISNRWKARRVLHFFIFSSREESHPNGPRFYFSCDIAICPEMQFQQTRRLAKSCIA